MSAHASAILVAVTVTRCGDRGPSVPSFPDARETPAPSAEETPLLPFPLVPALEPTQSDPTATPTPEADAEARPSDREALPAAFLLPAFLRPDAVPGAAPSPGYPYTLEEAASIEISSSPDWWVSSGARVDFDSVTTGRTIQGELDGADRWRLIYGGSNPVDTDDGYHPQNILRLVRRSRWQNFRQEAYFRINRLHHSSSPNRNQSNGLLLFHRYQSSQTLYYAGLRVDGAAVIKKKLRGAYSTLAYNRVFPGVYDLLAAPNLLPVGRWIGIRTTIVNGPDGSVSLRLFLDLPDDSWGFLEVATVVDTGAGGNGEAILDAGYVGIRLDFMDVDFAGHSVETYPPQPTATMTPPAGSTPSPTRTATRTPTPRATPSLPPAPPLTCRRQPVTRAGTDGDDVITGTAGRDVIHGGKGDDTIRGKGGNDLLCGGEGNDSLNGGRGDDFLDGGPGLDRCRDPDAGTRRRSCE